MPVRIERILCPVDASEPSAHALTQAIACSRWSGGPITALHVSAPIYVEDPALAALAADRQRSSEAAVRRWMEGVTECSHSSAKIDLRITTGAPAREIVDCARHLPADLIVMGTHGTSGFEHFALGSVAEKVLRHAPCPVLTVPPHQVATSRLPFTRVLCAIDFSDCSLAALEYAMTAALQSGAALTLTHVLEWPWHEPPAPAFDELPPQEAAALAAFRQRREHEAMTRLTALEPDRLRNRCHLRVSHGRAYTELLRVAADERADLIVLGVHGRNPIDMTLFGSTANQIVRLATCPVLTVRR